MANFRERAEIDEMELRANLGDGCHGSVKRALPACERPALEPVTAVQDITTSKLIDSFTNKGAKCDIRHRVRPFLAVLPGFASSLVEAPSFQSADRAMSCLGLSQAVPIQKSSVTNVSRAQVGRIAFAGVPAGESLAPAFRLKVSGAWGDKAGAGSYLLVSWFFKEEESYG